MVRKDEQKDVTPANPLAFKQTGFQEVGTIQIPDIFYKRFTTGVQPLDELLGGQGFLPGMSFTVTGRGGAGKTTLLLQMMEALSMNGKVTGYASGEESIFQIAYNAKRMDLKHVQIANCTDVDELAKRMKELDMLIIDSWQFITCSHIDKRKAMEVYAINKLVKAAQENSCVLGIIQHLTVMGTAKGGTLIPHTVDMNMMIENVEFDDESGGLENLKRIEIYKNRFGRIGSINLEMTDKGFDFSKVVKVETSAKMKAAKKKGEKEKAQILAFISEHKAATIDQLHQELGASWKIRHYLRILTNDDVLEKQGRGQEAVWKAGKNFASAADIEAIEDDDEEEE